MTQEGDRRRDSKLMYLLTQTPAQPKIRTRYKYKPEVIPVWDFELELNLLRDACRRDFWTYFQNAFGAKYNPKGSDWVDPDVHIPMADWYQRHVFEWLKWRKNKVRRQKHL